MEYKQLLQLSQISYGLLNLSIDNFLVYYNSEYNKNLAVQSSK